MSKGVLLPGFSCLPATTFLLLAACNSRYDEFTLPAGRGSGAGFLRPRITMRPGPVMTRSGGESWERVDVLNPSVVRFEGRLLNLYSGYDGKTWHTGVAESVDGYEWKRLGRALSPQQEWEGKYIAANGSAMVRDGEILYWYQAGDPPRIGLARSRDAKIWVRHDQPVLPNGPRGSWDERAAADPYVVEIESELYMFYLGQNRARQQRLGLARSADGVEWTKLREPILDLGAPGTFDENGLGEPAVWSALGRHWMLYTGRDRWENRRIGLAFSRDGDKWEKYGEAAVLSGNEKWNSRVVCDPTVLVDPGGRRVRIWYGGGDVAHPAENINGQIGYAELLMESQ